MSKDFDPKTAVHTPQEVADLGLKAIRGMSEKVGRGLVFPVLDIQNYFAPVLPGQVVAIIAQTSNYKSGFMHFWEREAAEQLMNEGRLDEAIIHVSVEECVEEQSYLYLSRETGEDAGKLARGSVQDWAKLEAAAVRIGNIPIYRIGDSIARAEDMPELYLSNMVRSIRSLTSGEVTGKPVKPAAIFYDYLQAFPFDPEVRRANPTDQRRLQVREDIYRLRQSAAFFDCPAIVGVQAKQHLEGAPDSNFQQPGIYDGEESSAIAQRADRIVTLWMPKQTHSIGTTFERGGIAFTVTENMMFLKVAKQRGGLPAGKTWECRIDFIKNFIAPVGRP